MPSEDISWSKKQIRANIEMMGISTELDETTGIEKYFMIIANHQTKTFNVGYIRDGNYCLKKECCYSFPWSDEVVLDYHFCDVLKLIERYIDKGFKIDSSLSLDSTLEGKSFSFTIY